MQWGEVSFYERLYPSGPDGEPKSKTKLKMAKIHTNIFFNYW